MLDIKLPGKDGWTVLDELKANPRTPYIPVHIISVEEACIRALEKGAVGFLSKPVCREDLEAVLRRLSDVYDCPMKDLLVVEDDPHLRNSIIMLIGNGDVTRPPKP